MNVSETFFECGTLHVAVNTSEERGGLQRAAQRIRWLPDVLAVADDKGELEVVFRAPGEGLLRRIHQTLQRIDANDRGFSEP